MEPSIGLIVRYRLPEGPQMGEIRPAMIVRLRTDEGEVPGVDLNVFTDGKRDGFPALVLFAGPVVEGDGAGEYSFVV